MGSWCRKMAGSGFGRLACSYSVWKRLPVSMADTYRVLGKGSKAKVLGTHLPQPSAADYGHFCTADTFRKPRTALKIKRNQKQSYMKMPRYSTSNSDYGRFYHIKGAVLPRTLPVRSIPRASQTSFIIQ